MKIINTVITLFLSFFLTLSPFLLTQTIAAEQSGNSLLVTATFNQVVMSDVLQELKSQTGYAFVIPDEFSTLKVSGNYNNIELENFFHRIFKKKNFSLVIDEKEKTIVVRDFEIGEAVNEKTNTTELQPEKKMFTADEELVKMQQQQMKIIQQNKNNPNYIHPESGLTVGYLAKLHKQQRKEWEQKKLEEGYVDPMTTIISSD